MEIDETLNAVELKKAGNIISLSNSNSFTESLGIGKENCRKLILRNSLSFQRCLGELLVENNVIDRSKSLQRKHTCGWFCLSSLFWLIPDCNDA